LNVDVQDAMLRAVVSPRRREILRLVWSTEMSSRDIASHFDVSWPAISQSLRLLKNSGLVIERRQGTHRYYKADRRGLGPLEAVLRQMWTRDLGRLRELAEQEARSRKKRHD